MHIYNIQNKISVESYVGRGIEFSQLSGESLFLKIETKEDMTFRWDALDFGTCHK